MMVYWFNLSEINETNLLIPLIINKNKNCFIIKNNLTHVFPYPLIMPGD